MKNRTFAAAALTLLSLWPAAAGQESRLIPPGETISTQRDGPSEALAASPPATDLSSAAEPEQRPEINTPAVEQPGDEAAPSIREIICQTIATAAQAHDLPVVFFTRLIWQESKFNPQAVSRAGAQGVAQFMPKVAAGMGLHDPFDPEQALPMSARLLRELHRRFGNWGLAAAAYNAGSRRVQEWLDKRGKLPKETRDYVLTITGVSAERWTDLAPTNVELTLPAKVPCPDLPEAEVHMAGIAAPLPPKRPREVVVTANDAPAQMQADDVPDEISARKRKDRKRKASERKARERKTSELKAKARERKASERKNSERKAGERKDSKRTEQASKGGETGSRALTRTSREGARAIAQTSSQARQGARADDRGRIRPPKQRAQAPSARGQQPRQR